MNKKLKGNAILIVEDDADIRTFASRVLELEGYTVLQAESGEEGLKLVREKNVSLVLLDLRLPGENGWTVMEKMKSEAATTNIPIIVFTASVGAPQYQRAKEMGAVGYLAKPLSATALKNEVNRILRQEAPPPD